MFGFWAPGDQLSVARVLYKPFSIVFGILGGLAAGLVYKRIWRATTHEPAPPEPTEKHTSWRRAATASALHGAVYGGVKALVQRGGATAFARLTGAWPGPKAG